MSQFAQEMASELSSRHSSGANPFRTMEWVARQWGANLAGTQRVQLYDASALRRSGQITSKELVRKCQEILQ